jgi:hypothetical protein
MAQVGHEHVPGTRRSGSTGAGREGRSSESISDDTVLLNNGVLTQPSFIYISPQAQTHINWAFNFLFDVLLLFISPLTPNSLAAERATGLIIRYVSTTSIFTRGLSSNRAFDPEQENKLRSLVFSYY